MSIKPHDNEARVINIIGATLVLTVLGIIALLVTGNPVPDVLVALGTGALSGLLGLLARPEQRPTDH